MRKVILIVLVVLISCAKKNQDNNDSAPNSEQSVPEKVTSHIEADVKKTCIEQWAYFNNSFTAKTPIGSLNKTIQWKVTASEIDTILNKGSGLLSLPFTFYDDGLAYSSYDISKVSYSYKRETRSEIMHQNVLKLIKAHPKNDLLIIHTGLMHSADIYFDNPEMLISYASTIANEKSVYGNDAYREYQGHLINPKIYSLNNTLDSATLNFANLYSLYYFKNSKFRKYELNKIMDNQLATDSNVIMMQDIHNINETSTMDSLPEASCLKEKGYNSVTLALEDSTFLQEYTAKEMLDKFSFKAQLSQAVRDNTKYKNPRVSELIETDQIRIAPARDSLINKVNSYSPDLEVIFTGIN